MDARRLPDFLGIGAEKCATTWIHRCLRSHPSLWLPALKEVRFFDVNYAKGVPWYAQHFAGAPSKALIGEISPQYMRVAGAAARIAAVLPEVKLVVSLRNPIDRAYSQYWMHVRAWQARGVPAPSFEEAIERSDAYVERGMYARQLAPYMESVGRGRMCLVSVDEIEQHPAEVCVRLYRFLGVDDSVEPPGLNDRVNAASEYTFPWLFGRLRGLAHRCERGGLEPVVRWAREIGVRDVVVGRLERSTTYPPMRADTRNRLAALYEEENRRLAELIGSEIPAAWS